MRPNLRHGYTLIEILIATTIFVVAFGMMVEAMLAAKSYEALGNAQDDVQLEGRKIMRGIADDLIASSWAFPDPTATTSGVTKASDRGLRYYPYVQLQEAVSGQTTGLGTAFPHHRRVPALVGPKMNVADQARLTGLGIGSPADESTLFTTANRVPWLQSYFARSQEIIFLVATNALWDATADTYSVIGERPPLIAFSDQGRAVWRTPNNHQTLNVLHPSGWSVTKDVGGNILGYVAHPVNPLVPAGATADTEPYGVVMEAGLLVDPTGDLSKIEVNWRTLNGDAFTLPPLPVDRIANLKEYSYSVVPSQIGLGRLVRTVRVNDAATRIMMNPAANLWAEPGRCLSRVGNDGMVVDKVMSDNVTRIVFDTYRTVDEAATTVTSLDINQVKVRLYMARPSEHDRDVIVHRMLETVVAMRSMNSARDKDFSQADASSLSNNLGTLPIGISY